MNTKSFSYLSFLLVLMPLFEAYTIGGVMLSVIFTALLILYCVLFRENVLIFKYKSRAFLLYALLVPNIVALTLGYIEYIRSSITLVLIYACWQCLVIPKLNIKKVLVYYRVLVYICCGFLIVQEIMYGLLGYRVSGLIPFLPIIYSDISSSEMIEYQMHFSRSSSFFLEPAHMAEFIIPYLAITLGRHDSTLTLKNMVEPLIISVILFFLRSGCGVVCTAFIWLFYLFNIRIHLKKKILLILFSTLIGIILLIQLASTEVGIELLGRTTELDVNNNTVNSGGIRIYRGFFVFDDTSLYQQIFGVGTGGAINTIENSKYFYMFFDNERYLNNVQMLLIGYGYLGTMLFLCHLKSLYTNNLLAGKLILLSFVILCFLENFFMTSKMIFYVSLIFLFKDMASKKKSIVEF